MLTRLPSRLHFIRPIPAFPSPVASGWDTGSWAFPWASHPAHGVHVRRMPGQGRALSTSPKTNRRSSRPSNRSSHSQCATSRRTPRTYSEHPGRFRSSPSCSRWAAGWRLADVLKIHPSFPNSVERAGGRQLDHPLAPRYRVRGRSGPAVRAEKHRTGRQWRDEARWPSRMGCQRTARLRGVRATSSWRSGDSGSRPI